MPENQTLNGNKTHLIIRPPKKWVPVELSELWEYRELLHSFVSRHVKIRYKLTTLGFLWGNIQPLFMMIIFTLFFGGFAKIPSDVVPYPLFSFAALLPGTLLSEGLSRSTTNMVSNAGITTKVYFPRLVMQISGIWSNSSSSGACYTSRGWISTSRMGACY